MEDEEKRNDAVRYEAASPHTNILTLSDGEAVVVVVLVAVVVQNGNSSSKSRERGEGGRRSSASPVDAPKPRFNISIFTKAPEKGAKHSLQVVRVRCGGGDVALQDFPEVVQIFSFVDLFVVASVSSFSGSNLGP
ncbi:hypothetical protein EYF80_011126 [Liparis tanakae]|uniref:Uncharacterized protein n=1 Tax=Liparis tanakae TaxID=230148 RepID=A0A4Z2INC1_9TELE|nr:hypothetical protein EYF80_011126 [Liparis tanakae]